MELRDFRNIPFGISGLHSVYPGNKAVVAKANRLENSGEIIRLKRGMYVLNPKFSGERINEFLIANHLYGPSYVSRQSALRYYGLIPERVYEITSMTSGLAKSFSNSISNFSYTHCSPSYFSIGLTIIEEEGVRFLIATPEKALCDLMIYTPYLNLRYTSEIYKYLEEDIRFDMDELRNFNPEIIKQCGEKGKKKNMIDKLLTIFENERNI